MLEQSSRSGLRPRHLGPEGERRQRCGAVGLAPWSRALFASCFRRAHYAGPKPEEEKGGEGAGREGREGPLAGKQR